MRGYTIAAVVALTLPASAQVTNDGSLGSNGPGLVGNVPNAGGGLDYRLTEADGERRGGNLFHSLGRMDLGSQDAAVYQGDAGIDNLITRITGGSSSIDGEIRSEIAGANLFLINPDGIVFGENARLNVTGDTVISTAHEVQLGESGRFDTRAAGGDILTVDPPSAFGFAAPAAPIVLQGSQIVGADSHSLALIGGNLVLSGARSDGEPGLLSAPGGRIDLASVRSSGTVRIVEGTEPDLVLEEVATRGDVLLTDNFVVSSSGVRQNPLNPSTRPAPGSGPIFVSAANLTVEDASEIRVLTVTNQPAGNISIDLTGDLIVRNAGDDPAVIVSGSGLTQPVPPGQVFTGIVRQVDPSIGMVRDLALCQGGVVCGVTYLTPAAAGDIEISARNLRLEAGGELVSRSEFSADAGEIRIDLTGDATIDGVTDDGIASAIFSNAVGSGDQGRILLHMPDGELRMDNGGRIVIENGAVSTTASAAGLIEIEAAALDMSGNARIDSSTRGAGPGGAITLDIDGHARLRGATDGETFTGISTLSQPGSTGAAGSITLDANSLEILDGAQISARPVGTGALGPSGSIAITVADDLTMHRGTISTESQAAGGGMIDIGIGGIGDLRDSAITSSVTQGAGGGGDVKLVPRSTAIVLQNSRITAQAFEGDGGELRIWTQSLVQDADSLTSATSTTGVGLDGVEEYQSQELSDFQLMELPVPPIDTSSLLREACALRDPGAASTFIVEPDPGPRAPTGDILPAFVSDALPPDVGDAAGGAGAPASICRR
jgi:filamentous hemagglutinin family protein